MLLDVIKQKEKERQEGYLQELEKYNHPYKRDTIIYFQDIHIIGGIEKWIENLSKEYEFSVVYDTGDKERINYLESKGIELIRNVGQEIECDTLLFMLWGNCNIKAKHRYLFIHGIYDEPIDVPECEGIYAVSKVAAEHFSKTTGKEVKVLYNPIRIDDEDKPLIIGVFSRFSKEKGVWRYKYLADKLIASSKPFLMLVFTDYPIEETEHIKMMPPVMNPIEWMKKCDYIANLSDIEAGSITIQESLKLGIPLIVTKLEILDEFKIDKTNAKILEMDMSNLDIEDLWNIPKVKWQEPVSKEWEFMKKKVLREKKEEPKKEEIKIEKEEVKEEPKKKTTKKVK